MLAFNRRGGAVLGLGLYRMRQMEDGQWRFLTGLGVGGEWAAGAALLAETWPEKARAKGAAILQTSAGMGYFAAAFIYLLVGGYSWRLVFVVGAFPAALVFFTFLGAGLVLVYLLAPRRRWPLVPAAFVGAIQQGATARCREQGLHVVVESLDTAPGGPIAARSLAAPCSAAGTGTGT